ncbi:uncharacterized protein [Amphiura filiformis]|uniref:uncharacterized protein n=1 Tax=Amphiura filiformis TaxID=82378 RepID=UPI003B2230FA
MEPFQEPGVIVPGLPMRKVLQMMAKMYHAPTIKESLGEGCRTLSPILKRFLGKEMVDMTCGAVLDSLKKGTHLETSDMCIELSNDMDYEQQEYQFSGGPDYQGFDPKYDEGVRFNQYDEYQDVYAYYPEGYVMNSSMPNGRDYNATGPDQGMMAFYDRNSPLYGIMKVLAMRYGLFDMMNPYSICDAGIDIIQTPMQDIISLAKEMAAMALSKLFGTQYPMSVCTMDSSGTSNYGGSNAYDQEYQGGMEPSIEDLLPLVAFAADVEDHARFCELITTATGNAADDENFLKTLASAMVNKVFSALKDAKTCTPMANIIYNMSPETVSHITGKQSGAAFCKVIIDAFNLQNSQNFKPPKIPDMSTIMESQEEPFQSAGKIFSFLSVDNLVKLAGKLYNQKSPLGSLGVLCSNYGKHLRQIPEVGGVLGEMCSMIVAGEVDDMSRKCYSLAVPAMLGPQYPVALRSINFPFELMKILLPLVNHPVSLEPENICSAQEELINSDMSIQSTAEELLDGLIPILIDYGHGICGETERIYDFLKPKNTSCSPDYNGEFIAWDGSPCAEFLEREMNRFDNEFNGMLRIAITLTGFRNKNELCRNLKAVVNSKDETQFETLVSDFKDQLLSFLFEERQCTNLLNSIQIFMETLAPAEEVRAQFYQMSGYRTTQALCVDTARLFNRKKKEVCKGIVDCAGVCNGDAVRDCMRVCMGPAVRDCAGECNGEAYENNCGFCVGGRSRRPDDFGTDKCGVCRSGEDYRITTDCHGTCYGSAFFDKCGECVGGETGRSDSDNDHRYDCRGICDGGWVQDACGYCKPPRKVRGDAVEIDPSTISKQMDCHGTCHRPGTRPAIKARMNECGFCVGGETGLELTEGMNACDQCLNMLNDTNVNETLSCMGCDGVAKSGKEFDACGVCGGDGSNCIAVEAVSPSAVKENSPTKVVLSGAGFDKKSQLKCVFIVSGGAQYSFDMTDRVSRQEMACEVNLGAGVYEVAVERDGTLNQDDSDSGPILTVFQDTVILEMTPTDIDLGEDTFEAFLTADVGAFTNLKEIGKPFIIAEGDAIKSSGERFLIPGKFATDVDNELQFIAPVPDHSMRVHVWGSLDGINKLSMGTAGSVEGFSITFWAEEPMFTKLQLDSNGASLTAGFDLRVAYKSLSSCNDIFQYTTKLGQGARCIWKGPKRLKIVIGKGNNLIVVGDELTLKTGAVKTFGQDYSYTAEGSQTVVGPRRSVSVRARLVGTERITSCGEVRLTARKSKGGAGRDMTYSWSVSSSADVTAIAALLAGVTGPDFTMDGTFMDADTVYTFEVTVTNFLGSSDFDSVEVSRSATATPEVEIIPRGVDIANALVSEKFKLTAEVTFYSDCVPPGATVFAWSVDNDQVPLNLRTINRRTLFVDANSLPGGENVTFTVKIYKESDPDKFVEQSIQISTRFSDLLTVIEGGSELTIGRDAGNVTIDGSSSFDPDDVAMDMTYEWLCEQVTDGTACWSYKIGEEGQFILSEAASSQAILQYDALAMEPDKMYTFTLVTSKGSRSSSSSVNVLSMNGDPPRVNIKPIEGKIRSDRIFSLKAKIQHTSTVSEFTWTTADTDIASADGEDEAFAYLDLNDDQNLVSPSTLMAVDETHSVTFLSIKRGKLTPGSAYMFQLNVTTVDGLYGLAKIALHILSEVTSCSFGLTGGVNEYTELDQVEIVIENCAADDTAYPLTYQLFVENDDGGLEAFTERQSEPRITGIGKPAREGTSINTLVAKVCDTYRSCTSFAQDFTVTPKESFSIEEAQELKATLVEEEIFKQNYMAALVNYNTISEKVDISGNITAQSERRRRAAASETSAQATEQLELMELILSSTVLDTATAQLTIDQLSAITATDMTLEDQDRLLDVVIQLVEVFKDSEESISESGVETVLALAAAIAQDMDPQYNAALFAKIETIEGAMSVSMLSQLVVGGSPIETIGEFSVTSIQRAIPTGVFHSKSSGGVAINFGADIASRFGADWVCSTGSCTGVAIRYDHFETSADFLSVTDEDKNNRAADIISISILDPESGEEIIIEDLTDPISINMTLTLPKTNRFYECSFWNATLSQWSTEGIATVEHSATDFECLSTHLTQFTVMALSNPTTVAPTASDDDVEKTSISTAVIAGSVVGGIAGILLLSLSIGFGVKMAMGRNIQQRTAAFENAAP